MELHEKYAPILRFNQDEQFYPMRVEDMLAYSSLYAKGREEPIVARGRLTPTNLARHGKLPTTYLRSVSRGPRLGQEVVRSWGKGALEMVYRWSAAGRLSLTEQLARKAYDWFSPKNSKAAELFWWNGLVRHALDEQLVSSDADELPRLILPQETRASAVEAFAARRSEPAYYYRLVMDGNFLCLQYWFFYSYNDWGQGFGGMNDHEGDWEGMMLFFRLNPAGRPEEPPAFVTFADHESRQTKPWGHEDVVLVGNHPVGYVAAGSHATYPEPKNHPLMKLYGLYDYATGNGRAIGPDDWVQRINLEDVPWLGQYKGSWGTRFWLPLEQAQNVLRLLLQSSPFAALSRLKVPQEIELPGVSAPHGPVGVHRPQYASPVTWAGIVD